MDSSLPINQGVVNKIMSERIFTPSVYTQTSHVYLTTCTAARACTSVLFTRVVSRVYLDFCTRVCA